MLNLTEKVFSLPSMKIDAEVQFALGFEALFKLRLRIELQIVFPVPQYSDSTIFTSLTDHTEGTDFFQ